ncbi:MAG: hypothetical protein WCJ37_03810 [Syntrophus sp. (in: bacteria)]
MTQETLAELYRTTTRNIPSDCQETGAAIPAYFVAHPSRLTIRHNRIRRKNEKGTGKFKSALTAWFLSIRNEATILALYCRQGVIGA